jgi:stage II sporulation protein GA (sporulation sigma-E factor processing peptidase)
LVDNHTGVTGEWYLSITYLGKSVTIKGLADTGNSLTDSFSGKPVVVCSKDSLRGIIDPDELASLKGFRLIPFSTIGEGGLVVSFIPDSVTITDTTQNYSKSIDVLIGISGTCDRAIFNPKVLV